jgi:hypothetical protein
MAKSAALQLGSQDGRLNERRDRRCEGTGAWYTRWDPYQDILEFEGVIQGFCIFLPRCRWLVCER